jgi:E3 ubiquitin-protein ligase RNF144
MGNTLIKRFKRKVGPKSSNTPKSNYNPEAYGMECSLCYMPCEDLSDTYNPTCCYSQIKIHESCMIRYLESKMEEGSTQIKCPNIYCGALLGTEILTSLLTPQAFERFNFIAFEKYLINAPDVVKCSSPTCNNFGFFNQNCTVMECTECSQKTCVKCSCPNHAGECDIESILKRMPNMRRCDRCKNYVEHNGGCIYVTCRCGYQFCFKCGAPGGTCNHQPGHTFYSVGAVLGDFKQTITCQCRYNKTDAICICK